MDRDEAITATSTDLYEFVLKHLDTIRYDGGLGRLTSHPEFDLYPRDYLGFASLELTQLPSVANAINCVAHLKRAVDCQVDMFMHYLGLLSIVHNRNLKFEKKLNFLADISVTFLIFGILKLLKRKEACEYGAQEDAGKPRR